MIALLSLSAGATVPCPTPAFAGQPWFSIEGYPTALEVGDFNCDGDDDLLWWRLQDAGDPGIALLFAPFADPMARITVDNATDVTIPDLAVGDLDGDGCDDLFLAGERNGWWWRGGPVIASGAGDGLGATQALLDGPIRTASSVERTFAIGDVNGDGFADVASGGHIWLGSPEGPRYDTAVSPASAVRPVGDVDGDGYADVVVVTFEQVSLVRGGLDGLRTDEPVPLLLDVPVFEYGQAATSFDRDGDGLPELAVCSRDQLWFFSAAGALLGSEVGYPLCRSDAVFDADIDMNGDGVRDLLALSAGRVDLWLGAQGIDVSLPSDSSWETTHQGYYEHSGFRRAVALDADLDGVMDLATIAYFEDDNCTLEMVSVWNTEATPLSPTPTDTGSEATPGATEPTSAGPLGETASGCGCAGTSAPGWIAALSLFFLRSRRDI